MRAFANSRVFSFWYSALARSTQALSSLSSVWRALVLSLRRPRLAIQEVYAEIQAVSLSFCFDSRIPVPTLTFSVLYCFFVISHDRRRILHFNVAQHPTSAWIVQQLREAFPYASAPKFLMLDQDAK